MNDALTLGSLFDGIGGFMLAGIYAGIRPTWSSEIDPFPIRVTEKHFPEVRQYGDVHALNGAELPPVDIISFGSPCVDLSVAGKRAGLDGKQSSLFFEAIRIIREMREKTNGEYPKWAVWENVPHALSSNHGRDFQTILENLVRLKDPETTVPMPETKWLSAGEIMGDGYSLAWRILDASKGWGVAQRRRRIFVVLDLDGGRAGKVLFESEGLSGYTPPDGEARENASCDPERCASTAISLEANPTDSRIGISDTDICQTLTARMGTGGNNVPLMLESPKAYGLCSYQSNAMLSGNPNSGVYEAKTSRTIDTDGGNPVNNQGGMMILTAEKGAVCATTGHVVIGEEVSPTLAARDYKSPTIVLPTREYRVRRLTPGECCRLQGYPDGWCENLGVEDPTEKEIAHWMQVFEDWKNASGEPGKPKTRNQVIKWLKDPYTDAAAYKAYGNSVAVPCVHFVLAGIVWCAQSDEGQGNKETEREEKTHE